MVGQIRLETGCRLAAFFDDLSHSSKGWHSYKVHQSKLVRINSVTSGEVLAGQANRNVV